MDGDREDIVDSRIDKLESAASRMVGAARLHGTSSGYFLDALSDFTQMLVSYLKEQAMEQKKG